MTGPRPQVVVALATPFDARGEVDLAAVRRHVELLVAADVDALMPAGTTGEGALLADAEVEALVAATAEAAAGRTAVIAHVGRPSTRATVELARWAVTAGAASISAVLPYYYAVTEEQALRHYRAVIEAVEVPVYAYTIPARTGNELSPAALSTLAGEGLAGLKDSTKSFERHLEYLAVGIPVLMGSDGMVLDALRAGAAGSVSAIANGWPQLLVRLRDAVAGGDTAEAEAAQADICRVRYELARDLPLVAVKRRISGLVDGYRPDLRAPLG